MPLFQCFLVEAWLGQDIRGAIEKLFNLWRNLRNTPEYWDQLSTLKRRIHRLLKRDRQNRLQALAVQIGLLHEE